MKHEEKGECSMGEKLKDQETIAVLAHKLGLPRRVLRCKYDEHFSLIELKLSSFERGVLPPEIGHFPHLRSLHLRHSKLRQVPEEIGQLICLERLHLDHNQLTVLPESLWHLHKLRYLHLDHNQLSDLPPDVGQLRELRSLELSANDLEYLPAEMGQLRHLRNLFLSQNRLATLPEFLWHLPSLLLLATDGNPLTKETLDQWKDLLPPRATMNRDWPQRETSCDPTTPDEERKTHDQST